MPWMLPAALVASSAIGAAGSAGAFGSSGNVTQRPMVTAPQAGAQNELIGYAQTGKTPWGYDFTQGYQGSLGNYDMTAIERQGQGALSSTLNQGLPSIFQSGTNTLGNILNTNAYDPNNDGGVYAGLTAGLDRNTRLAIDQTKQAGAFAGNLFSTNTDRNIGNINEQGSINKSNILAQLYQNFSNQKLQAANSAIGAGTAANNINLSQIGASEQYGALQRTLQDQKAKDAYSAWLTQSNRELQPLQAAATLSGQNANYGVQSVPVPSPWNQLLNTSISSAAYLAGQGYFGGGGNQGTGYGQPVVQPWQSVPGQYPQAGM